MDFSKGGRRKRKERNLGLITFVLSVHVHDEFPRILWKCRVVNIPGFFYIHRYITDINKYYMYAYLSL